MSARPTGGVGLDALLTPGNCALLLIDHQPFQLSGVGSHDPQTVVNNTVGLAKTARIFGVPTMFSTVLAGGGGALHPSVQEVFPDLKPIDRTWINAWQDPRVVEWVEQTGRKKIVIAGLFTEICLAMPAIQALDEGYEVYIVTDASGGVSLEAHQVAVQRMVQAGAVPITWNVVAAELQRDWARDETRGAFGEMLSRHGGSTGSAYLWEMQLLASGSAG